MARAFDAERDEWLRKHHSPNKIIRTLTDEYNAAFGENRTVDVIKVHCKKLGLKQEHGKPFTPEQDSWLRERSIKYTVKDLTELFNDTFGTQRKVNTMKVHCNRDLRIFFLNDHMRTGLPIGSEKIIHGYLWVKVSDEAHGANSFYKNWRQKSHIVWEKHYGCMPPKSYTIVFLDGNKENCDITNLYAVSGKVLREMSKKSWFRSDREFTLAAIKWCELFYKTKDVRNAKIPKQKDSN